MRYGVTYLPTAVAIDSRVRDLHNGKPYVTEDRASALSAASRYNNECQARVVRLVPKKPSYTQMMDTLYKALKDLKQTPRLYGGAEPRTTRTTVLSIVAQFWDAI